MAQRLKLVAYTQKILVIRIDDDQDSIWLTVDHWRWR